MFFCYYVFYITLSFFVLLSLLSKKYVLLFLDEPSGKAERLLSKKYVLLFFCLNFI